jgi:hypothetical protein
MTKLLLYITFFFSCFLEAKAQKMKSFEVSFLSFWKDKPLQLDEQYFLGNDTCVLSEIKFYISNIQLLDGDKVVFSERNSFHLINHEQPITEKVSLQIPENLHFTTVKYNFGIDSLTQIDGVKGGDLDPTNGMYWTWQSGYIHFKLEGKSRRCKGKNNEFQFHLGGFIAPFNTNQIIKQPIDNDFSATITFDAAVFLSTINLAETHHIMSPSKKAADLATKVFQSR